MALLDLTRCYTVSHPCAPSITARSLSRSCMEADHAAPLSPTQPSLYCLTLLLRKVCSFLTSVVLPTNRGLFSWMAEGATLSTRWSASGPRMPMPPACSAMNDMGAISYSSRALPLGAFRLRAQKEWWAKAV